MKRERDDIIDLASDSSSGSDSDAAPNNNNKNKKQKQKKPRLVTLTRARTEYKLTYDDLARLPTKPLERPNPHYKSAAPMQLYVLSEVKARAEEKQAEAAAAKAYLEAHADEIQEAKRQAARDAKEAAKAKVAAAHGGRARGDAEGRRGGAPLPDTCMARVLCCLAERAADPYGLVGPCLAARDIANASLACWDFYHASKPAFAALGDAVERVPFEWVQPGIWKCADLRPSKKRAVGAAPAAGGPLRGRHCVVRLQLGQDLSWEEWDKVLGSPMDLPLPQLKKAASVVGAKVTGTKAQLICWIQEQLGLAAPPTAPAKLLRACAAERSVTVNYAARADGGLRWLADGAAALQEKQRLAGEPATFGGFAGHLMGLRAALAAAGIATRAEFEAARAAAQAWLGERQRAQAEARRIQQEARRAEEEARRAQALEAAARRREAALFEQQKALQLAAAANGGGPAAAAMVARCLCGNQPSPTCANKCCRFCCGKSGTHATCERHNKVVRQ